MMARCKIGSSCGAAAVMVIVCVMGSSVALGQEDRRSPGDLPSASRLIEVPVTGLLPGVTEAAPPLKNPVAGDPEAAARGLTYFNAFNCSGCHATNGGGGMGPALSNRTFTYGNEPAQIYLSIAQGRPAGMPAWGSRVPPQAIWDLVAYIDSISNAPQEGWGRVTSTEAFEIEQAPQFDNTTHPWQNTQPFSFGQNPNEGDGDAPKN